MSEDKSEKPSKESLEENYKNLLKNSEEFTVEVIQKLESAFKDNLSETDACHYAGVTLQQLNAFRFMNPGFIIREAQLRTTLKRYSLKVIKAALNDGDLMAALNYLKLCADEESKNPKGKPVPVSLLDKNPELLQNIFTLPE